MSDSNPPKPKLRWYQFNLRTLLLFVMVAGVVFGLLGQRIQRIRNEIRATDKLAKLGGAILLHQQNELKDVLSIPDRWLWKCFTYRPVCDICFIGNQATDAVVENLKGLTSLQVLNLGKTQVTDAGLEHIKGLTSLQTLYLADTQITDVGLEHLKDLTCLQDLILDGTQVTDAGLEHIKGLTSLQELDLDGTQVTDAGLEYIKGLPSLHSLYLDDTQITDVGVKKLQKALPKCWIDRANLSTDF
ncbi:MAG: leucine-rich repeat domain-containing protein [Pirellulales bacterium]|nr:leucine-rich repeat domain-containing protein [Pirellulales bacterium]